MIDLSATFYLPAMITIDPFPDPLHYHLCHFMAAILVGKYLMAIYV